MLAFDRGDMDSAEKWAERAQAMQERLGIRGIAKTLVVHGMTALRRHELDAARDWFVRSLEIADRNRDDLDSSSALNGLGQVDEARGHLDDAERWYHKARELQERSPDKSGLADICLRLAVVLGKKGDDRAAERWYRKALSISEDIIDNNKLKNINYKLGLISQRRGDHEGALGHFHKAVEIAKRLGGEYPAAYGQIGIIHGIEGRFAEAGRWLIKGIIGFAQIRDGDQLRYAMELLGRAYQCASLGERAIVRSAWEEAGLGPFPVGGASDDDNVIG
jgi:tetratricopeptide (TPR) repeat protein